MIEGKTGTLLGTGNVAEVREHGDFVLKLYKPGQPKSSAFREAAVLAGIEPFGLPVPRVVSVGEHDGRWGLVMTRAPGRPFAETMLADPSTAPNLLDAMVGLHRRIHGCTASFLPALSGRLRANIASVDGLPLPLKARLLERLQSLPEGDSLCHGDFHPFNILGEPGAAMVIDWLDATGGAPEADVCRSYLLLSHHSEPVARDYVERYAVASGSALDDIFRWLPVLAAARLREGVAGERDRLMALAEAA